MPMNRREFFQTTYGTAGAAALVTALGAPQVLRSATPKKANDVLYLGPDKIKITRMAIGLGTNAGNVQRELGLQGVADYLKFAYDQGLFFWDTADAYKTHPHVKEALKSIPREKVTILTKTDVRTNAADMRAALDRYRQELGTDYIDILLLHGMRDPKWPEVMKPVMDVLSEAHEKKIIRSYGSSIHSLEALQLAATTPWCRVQFQVINKVGVRMDSTDVPTVVALLRQSKQAGKGIIGMKILGEGRLKDHRDEMLQFAVNLDCLDCFTIGAANRQELAHVIKRVEAVSA